MKKEEYPYGDLSRAEVACRVCSMVSNIACSRCLCCPACCGCEHASANGFDDDVGHIAGQVGGLALLLPVMGLMLATGYIGCATAARPVVTLVPVAIAPTKTTIPPIPPYTSDAVPTDSSTEAQLTAMTTDFQLCADDARQLRILLSPFANNETYGPQPIPTIIPTKCRFWDFKCRKAAKGDTP